MLLLRVLFPPFFCKEAVLLDYKFLVVFVELCGKFLLSSLHHHPSPQQKYGIYKMLHVILSKKLFWILKL